MSHLGGDAKCRHFRKTLYQTPELVPQSIYNFAKSFDDFTKQFIYIRFSHCPERLLNSDKSYSIVKQLNNAVLTKADPLETLVHFANMINNPDFMAVYMRADADTDTEDITLNFVFLEEFIAKFYNYGENWIWNYSRKFLFIALSVFFRVLVYLCMGVVAACILVLAPIAFIIFFLIVKIDRTLPLRHHHKDAAKDCCDDSQ